MSEGEKRKLQLTREQSLRALPVLAALLLVLGGWLLYAGIQRTRQDSQLIALQHGRDDAASAINRLLKEEQRRLGARLATEPVRNALAADDLAAAAKLVAEGWGDLRRSEVWPADLQPLYTALPAGGFGAPAVAEAALATGKPAARVIKGKGEQRLALAAPATAKQGPVVIYVEMPAARLIAHLGTVSIPGNAYLALRQGGGSLQERGDSALSGSAEALGTRVVDSDMRIAAALPDPVEVPFGLPALPGLALGVLLLLGAGALWFVVRPRMLGMRGAMEDAGATLAEMQLAQPAPETVERPVREVVDTQAAAAPVAIDRGIFRAYDIRGVVGQTLDAGVAELIGQAIGSLMEAKGLDDIVIGRDGRLSGPELSAGLIAGLRKAGRNVIDIGLAPTPLVYFGSYHLRTGCCVAITGSHNPPDYNGFKIVVGAETLAGPALADLYARIAEDRLHTARQEGGLSERDIGEDYVERIAGDIQIGKRLKVVVDAGNGVAGAIGPRVLEAIGADVTPLFCDIDGTFPNHHPDPSDPHNLEALAQMVKRLDADLGIAFDGDGDRVLFVDGLGRVRDGDDLLYVLACDWQESGRLRGPVVGTLMTNYGFERALGERGIGFVRAKVGDRYVHQQLLANDGVLGGEASGHILCLDRASTGDGIVSALQVLEVLQRRGIGLADALQGLRKVPQKTVNVRYGGAARPADADNVHIALAEAQRAVEGRGRAFLRASGTEPVVRVTVEADDAALVESTLEALAAAVRAAAA